MVVVVVISPNINPEIRISWLGGRKGIQPVKNRVVGCWCGCLEQGAVLHMAQLMPLTLTVSCFSKSRLVLPFWYRLTWIVPEKGPLNGCVCVCNVNPESNPHQLAGWWIQRIPEFTNTGVTQNAVLHCRH